MSYHSPSPRRAQPIQPSHDTLSIVNASQYLIHFGNMASTELAMLNTIATLDDTRGLPVNPFRDRVTSGDIHRRMSERQ